MRDEFMNEVEPHLSNLIDPDLEEENYNKRYAQCESASKTDPSAAR